MERHAYNLQIAIEAVFANRFRSILTALGIIFGVAAVIAMLAIGSGAQQEILEQIKLVGVNNIIIIPKRTDDADQEQEQAQQRAKKYSPGLTLLDAKSIREIIPSVANVSPEVVYEAPIIKDGMRGMTKLTGVTTDFFEVFNLRVEKGYLFTLDHLENGRPVALIGSGVKIRFFPNKDPIGEYIKCGHVWLQVIGVLENRAASGESTEELGISDYNNSIYAPIQTVLLRFKDRSLVTSASVSGGSSVVFFEGGMASYLSSGGETDNQLNKIVVQVHESSQLAPTSEIIRRMLKRRHQGVDDFEIKIPEMLLKQEQRTKDIFNIVLGAIAGISLVVGGIGIMNIMLASVMERIKEIGIRQASGARKTDIVFQFLAEATMISLSGGIIGILLGIGLAKLITEFTGILTIISPFSILISFGVAATVGIVFGYMPAKRASEQDPLTSLRYE
ncbi:MAG: ABC transporter permease [Bacteroidales bacterium]|nr:ABC transporter permease [Bacteroidales bacterium]